MIKIERYCDKCEKECEPKRWFKVDTYLTRYRLKTYHYCEPCFEEIKNKLVKI
jgi:hypothetical protein